MLSLVVGNIGYFDNEINLAGSEGLEGLKIDRRIFRLPRRLRETVLAFENGVAALTVDGKMAILHIYRPVQLWCGDYPAGLCRVSVGQKSTLCAYQMAVPGQRRTENPR